MSLEIHPERTVELTDLNRDVRERLRPWVAVGLAIALGLFLAVIGAGCATTEEEVAWQRICYEQLLGKDERGLVVVRHFCVKEEAK